jgi:hypothetical protein
LFVVIHIDSIRKCDGSCEAALTPFRRKVGRLPQSVGIRICIPETIFAVKCKRRVVIVMEDEKDEGSEQKRGRERAIVGLER